MRDWMHCWSAIVWTLNKRRLIFEANAAVILVGDFWGNFRASQNDKPYDIKIQMFTKNNQNLVLMIFYFIHDISKLKIARQALFCKDPERRIRIERRLKFLAVGPVQTHCWLAIVSAHNSCNIIRHNSCNLANKYILCQNISLPKWDTSHLTLRWIVDLQLCEHSFLQATYLQQYFCFSQDYIY